MISDKKCPKCSNYLEEIFYASDKPEGTIIKESSNGIYNCINPECELYYKDLSNYSDLLK